MPTDAENVCYRGGRPEVTGASPALLRQPQAAVVKQAAEALKLSISHIDLGSSLNEEACRAASDSIQKAKADLLMVADEPVHLSNSSALVGIAGNAQIPATYPFRDFVVAGGLYPRHCGRHGAQDLIVHRLKGHVCSGRYARLDRWMGDVHRVRAIPCISGRNCRMATIIQVPRAVPDKIDHILSWSGMQRIRIGRSWSETRRWPRINYRRCTPLA